jgi:hypothetical protein
MNYYPAGIRENTIELTLENANVTASSSIFGGFLKGIDSSLIKNIQNLKISKGEHSVDISLTINYFGEFAYPLIIGYFTYLRTGKDKPDINSSNRTVLLPFVRIAKYIASNVKRVGVTVNGITVSKVVMNKKVRDELLKKDYEELRNDQIESKMLLIREIERSLGSIEHRTFAEGYLAALGKGDYSELNEKQALALLSKLHRMGEGGVLSRK